MKYIKDIQQKNIRLDLWLSQEYKKNKNFGKKDRKWYSDVLFSIIRFAPLAILCEKLNRLSLDGKNKEQSLEEINQFLELIKSPEDFLSQLIKTDFLLIAQVVSLRVEDIDPKISSNSLMLNSYSFIKENQNYSYLILSAYYGFPFYFLNKLEARSIQSNFDDESKKIFIKKHSSRAPTWLRLNRSSQKERIMNEFENKNILIQNSEYENALILLSESSVYSTDSYENGLFEVQDLASQKICESIESIEAQDIWDACCGGGGKSIQLAVLFENKAYVLASDIRESKIKDAHKRAQRLKLKNIEFFNFDARESFLEEERLKKYKGFDIVLVDAPCSSSGTWRRNPEQAYFTTQSQLQCYQKLQIEILNSVSMVVKKGGVIIYSTCSFFVDENESVVDTFLSRHSDYSFIKSSLVGSPELNSDTLFYAHLKKN